MHRNKAGNPQGKLFRGSRYENAEKANDDL